MTAHHLLSWHAATYASCSPWLFSFDQQPITSKSTTYRNISFPSYLLPSLSQLPLRPELIPSYLPPLSTSGTKYLSHPPPVHHVPIQSPRRGNRLSRRGYPHLPSATAERRNPALGGDDPCRQAKTPQTASALSQHSSRSITTSTIPINQFTSFPTLFSAGGAPASSTLSRRTAWPSVPTRGASPSQRSAFGTLRVLPLLPIRQNKRKIGKHGDSVGDVQEGFCWNTSCNRIKDEEARN